MMNAQSVCDSKVWYNNVEEAQKAIKRIKYKRSLILYWYECPVCKLIHLTKQKQKKRPIGKSEKIQLVNRKIKSEILSLCQRIENLQRDKKVLKKEKENSIEMSELIIRIEKLKIEKYKLQEEKRILNGAM